MDIQTLQEHVLTVMGGSPESRSLGRAREAV
jgi:hypothetical protein